MTKLTSILLFLSSFALIPQVDIANQNDRFEVIPITPNQNSSRLTNICRKIKDYLPSDRIIIENGIRYHWFSLPIEEAVLEGMILSTLVVRLGFGSEPFNNMEGFYHALSIAFAFPLMLAPLITWICSRQIEFYNSFIFAAFIFYTKILPQLTESAIEK